MTKSTRLPKRLPSNWDNVSTHELRRRLREAVKAADRHQLDLQTAIEAIRASYRFVAETDEMVLQLIRQDHAWMARLEKIMPLLTMAWVLLNDYQELHKIEPDSNPALDLTPLLDDINRQLKQGVNR